MESLMMEEKKQLDFNRPLISVRRPIQTPEPNSKTSSSNSVTNKIPRSPPVYKSDINSGPIRNPGTVPFQWEHKPGKPKDERKPELQSVVQQHFVPKLPPGRIVKSREREELVRKPEPRVDHVEDARSCSSSWYDDDDTYDTYLDSRSDSFFFNCSNVSGVSGLDGQRMLVEPFGTLSSDRQTQDLMMGRFLPAAKALTTSETPPHLARKPPKPEEPARQIVVVKEKQNKAEQNPYRFHHSPDYQEEEDGDMSSMMASGVCGLLPQICLRSSFGVLNPVPSVRMKAQRGVSVRRMRSKYQDSCNGSSQDEALSVSSTPPEGREKLENLSSGSRTKTSKKNFGELLASDDNTWKPSSHEALVVEKTLYVDTVHSVNKKVQEASNEQSILQSYPTLDVVPVKEDVEASKEEVISGLKVEDCADQAIAEVVEIAKEKIDFEVRLQQGTTKNLESSRLHHNHHIVAPPPLPKAPSDSWLKRTLPTVPSKNNAFTWLQSLGTDDNNQITKWETMVKTSNTQQGFVCFSKETLNPIPEA